MTTELLLKSLANRILVLDGAMGTAIQQRHLVPADFGGPEYEGCNEHLILTRPEVIRSIHQDYLKAGCDILETNTFGATPLVLDEYGLGSKAYEINFNASQIARELADRYSTPGKPRFVAGSMGPTTKAISVTGGITFEELQEHFYAQAKALLDGGVDYFLVETCPDTRNVKAALLAIQKLFETEKKKIPIAVSGTIEATGTMLAGQTIEAFLASLSHLDLLYIGINCATGPEFMTEHIRSLAKLSKFPVACVPNAGLPDEHGHYLETPEMFRGVVSRFVESGWVNVLGGCCGTGPGHIEALARLAAASKPRNAVYVPRSVLSGIDYLEISDEIRPVIVGERTNVIGSKKFRDLICQQKFEEASEVARAQIKNGAQVIDICVANPDRDELQDMRSYLEATARKIRTPLMIDSTDARVLELALSYSQGKAIINSINLEDGEERFAKVTPLARKYGAALVVGCIDDDPNQGMGITRERKLAIAERSYALLTQKYGIPAEDIYFDPLVFPCATGDAQYLGSAVETIEGLRAIKKKFPLCKTVLGISNVSFGLPPAGREVLNSVFLYHCVQAGLDLAIVNSEKLERYAGIPEEERKLSEALLYGKGTQNGAVDPVAAFAAHFRERKATEKSSKSQRPLAERLARYVIEGSKDGLVEDLDEAIKAQKPLEIINGPLMKGMDEVGKLFNANQLIVAEVLQSAEVMKAAVSHLEPYMGKKESATRGKVLLATVKGDVHDIGKNLVEIILSNNGFQVVNLGIRVPPEQLIQATREHQPDMIGLSGLLVKSAHQMVATAEDFAKAGIETPILVGGAALSANFVDQQIAKAYKGTVAYASDAMSGLDLAKTIVDPERFEKLKAELTERRNKPKATVPRPAEAQASAPTVTCAARSPAIPAQHEIPTPPDFERHVLKNTPIEQIWRYINPLMLYGRHLGIRGSTVKLLEQVASNPAGNHKLHEQLKETEPKALDIWNAVEEVKAEYRETEILKPSAVYQFFHAGSEGDQIQLFDPKGTSVAQFQFARQAKGDHLCLSDYIYPVNKDFTPPRDNIAVFVVTVGKGVREIAESLKNRGDYLKSHIIQALALESAEAYAELLHAQIRKMWGFPDAPDMKTIERFQARYRGKRYSFGYPACPKLDNQKTLFAILKPEELGVQLTEGMMMDPESSVSALVFHHPLATYFSVGNSLAASSGETTSDNR